MAERYSRSKRCLPQRVDWSFRFFPAFWLLPDEVCGRLARFIAVTEGL